MSAFHESCKKLTDQGILPQTVVQVARVTSCATVLAQAFPTLPPLLRANLLMGRANIVFDNTSGWCLEYAKAYALA